MSREIREAARVLAMCSWLRKQIAKIEDAAKVVADVTFSDEKTAGVVDDQVVSYTSRVARKPEIEVLDEANFVCWVATFFPTEIVSAVRPSFLTKGADEVLAPKLSGVTLAELPGLIKEGD